MSGWTWNNDERMLWKPQVNECEEEEDEVKDYSLLLHPFTESMPFVMTERDLDSIFPAQSMSSKCKKVISSSHLPFIPAFFNQTLARLPSTLPPSTLLLPFLPMVTPLLLHTSLSSSALSIPALSFLGQYSRSICVSTVIQSCILTLSRGKGTYADVQDTLRDHNSSRSGMVYGSVRGKAVTDISAYQNDPSDIGYLAILSEMANEAITQFPKMSAIDKTLRQSSSLSSFSRSPSSPSSSLMAAYKLILEDYGLVSSGEWDFCVPVRSVGQVCALLGYDLTTKDASNEHDEGRSAFRDGSADGVLGKSKKKEKRKKSCDTRGMSSCLEPSKAAPHCHRKGIMSSCDIPPLPDFSTVQCDNKTDEVELDRKFVALACISAGARCIGTRGNNSVIDGVGAWESRRRRLAQKEEEEEIMRSIQSRNGDKSASKASTQPFPSSPSLPLTMCDHDMTCFLTPTLFSLLHNISSSSTTLTHQTLRSITSVLRCIPLISIYDVMEDQIMEKMNTMSAASLGSIGDSSGQSTTPSKSQFLFLGPSSSLPPAPPSLLSDISTSLSISSTLLSSLSPSSPQTVRGSVGVVEWMCNVDKWAECLCMKLCHVIERISADSDIGGVSGSEGGMIGSVQNKKGGTTEEGEEFFEGNDEENDADYEYRFSMTVFGNMTDRLFTKCFSMIIEVLNSITIELSQHSYISYLLCGVIHANPSIAIPMLFKRIIDPRLRKIQTLSHSELSYTLYMLTLCVWNNGNLFVKGGSDGIDTILQLLRTRNEEKRRGKERRKRKRAQERLQTIETCREEETSSVASSRCESPVDSTDTKPIRSNVPPMTHFSLSGSPKPISTLSSSSSSSHGSSSSLLLSPSSQPVSNKCGESMSPYLNLLLSYLHIILSHIDTFSAHHMSIFSLLSYSVTYTLSHSAVNIGKISYKSYSDVSSSSSTSNSKLSAMARSFLPSHELSQLENTHGSTGIIYPWFLLNKDPVFRKLGGAVWGESAAIDLFEKVHALDKAVSLAQKASIRVSDYGIDIPKLKSIWNQEELTLQTKGIGWDSIASSMIEGEEYNLTEYPAHCTVSALKLVAFAFEYDPDVLIHRNITRQAESTLASSTSLTSFGGKHDLTAFGRRKKRGSEVSIPKDQKATQVKASSSHLGTTHAHVPMKISHVSSIREKVIIKDEETGADGSVEEYSLGKRRSSPLCVEEKYLSGSSCSGSHETSSVSLSSPFMKHSKESKPASLTSSLYVTHIGTSAGKKALLYPAHDGIEFFTPSRVCSEFCNIWANEVYRSACGFACAICTDSNLDGEEEPEKVLAKREGSIGFPGSLSSSLKSFVSCMGDVTIRERDMKKLRRRLSEQDEREDSKSKYSININNRLALFEVVGTCIFALETISHKFTHLSATSMKGKSMGGKCDDVSVSLDDLIEEAQDTFRCVSFGEKAKSGSGGMKWFWENGTSGSKQRSSHSDSEESSSTMKKEESQSDIVPTDVNGTIPFEKLPKSLNGFRTPLLLTSNDMTNLPPDRILWTPYSYFSFGRHPLLYSHQYYVPVANGNGIRKSLSEDGGTIYPADSSPNPSTLYANALVHKDVLEGYGMDDGQYGIDIVLNHPFSGLFSHDVADKTTNKNITKKLAAHTKDIKGEEEGEESTQDVSCVESSHMSRLSFLSSIAALVQLLASIRIPHTQQYIRQLLVGITTTLGMTKFKSHLPSITDIYHRPSSFLSFHKPFTASYLDVAAASQRAIDMRYSYQLQSHTLSASESSLLSRLLLNVCGSEYSTTSNIELCLYAAMSCGNSSISDGLLGVICECIKFKSKELVILKEKESQEKKRKGKSKGKQHSHHKFDEEEDVVSSNSGSDEVGSASQDQEEEEHHDEPQSGEVDNGSAVKGEENENLGTNGNGSSISSQVSVQETLILNLICIAHVLYSVFEKFSTVRDFLMFNSLIDLTTVPLGEELEGVVVEILDNVSPVIQVGLSIQDNVKVCGPPECVRVDRNSEIATSVDSSKHEGCVFISNPLCVFPDGSEVVTYLPFSPPQMVNLRTICKVDNHSCLSSSMMFQSYLLSLALNAVKERNNTLLAASLKYLAFLSSRYVPHPSNVLSVLLYIMAHSHTSNMTALNLSIDLFMGVCSKELPSSELPLTREQRLEQGGTQRNFKFCQTRLDASSVSPLPITMKSGKRKSASSPIEVVPTSMMGSYPYSIHHCPGCYDGAFYSDLAKCSDCLTPLVFNGDPWVSMLHLIDGETSGHIGNNEVNVGDEEQKEEEEGDEEEEIEEEEEEEEEEVEEEEPMKSDVHGDGGEEETI
ncbi:hypothetical protein ADUPG1_011066, partial [Aduncisulcus paluster]